MRSVALAYAVPPVLAFVLGFVGLLQLSEAGVVGATSVVTAASGPETASNGRVADALERVAQANGATVVRVVADRSAPTTRRVALVTDAPSSRGATWLRDGYADFSNSMTTLVRPITGLDEFDPTGSYDVFGDDRARIATVDALDDLGFDVTSERVPLLQRIGVTAGLSSTAGLVAALTLGCVTLCLTGTVGAPRRIAVRRLHGRSTGSVLLAELSEVRTTLVVLAVGAPAATIGLWFHNGLASGTTLVWAFVVFCAALLLPIVAAHTVGTLLAARHPLADALRGARPTGAVQVVAQVARVPALLLLVAAVFDLSGAAAVARAGTAERDLRAAGETVQLWVTPDPRPVGAQEYWDRIGAFTSHALDSRDALLSAAVEVSTGNGSNTVPALFVDPEYLRLQDIRADDGTRVTARDDRISVWLPASSVLAPDRLARALSGWELRNAPDGARAHIAAGRLAAQDTYAYPGDASSRSWFDDAVLVVVPDPAEVFSADQLGSWLSTGDVVFTSRPAAERSIGASDLRQEFSAVVDVGQVAAERARHAATAVGVAAATVASSLVVSVVLATLSTVAHRRRHGRSLFTKLASRMTLLRADAGLLTAEVTLLAVGVVATIDTWWDRRPDGTGLNSSLDPVSQSAGAAGVLAAITLAVLSAATVALMASTARVVARTRGNGSR